ncbi:hypothetical protein [Sphingobium lactosutens]|uniref:Uncharacterized protein n=1 Tax=Sphingobium lactosutens DS20 TaxID=1331060 RepID=T0ISU8_9SPHN|nr:hypothetical protein [Sphingobium lactosutens]EQB14895.1 hypothetical protein RLDS_12050 [Sphingobium lactosutens DS20]
MADRVSAHIMMGGVLVRSRYPEFVQAIGNDNPAIDWDGTPFNPIDIPIDTPLALMDHDVANGRFEEIEHVCRRHGLHYVRWSGGYPGSFPSVRMLYLGHGEPKQVLTTEEDEQVFPIERIRELGSIGAIEAEYQLARMNPPPLVLVDDDSSDPALSETVHG